MKRLVAYPKHVLDRQYTAALVQHNQAMHQAQHKGWRLFLKMLGDYTPPSYHTMVTIEEDFETKLVCAINGLLIDEGVILEDFKPLDLPLLSISYDTTPLGLKGLHAITLNGHFLSRNFEPINVGLFTGVFSLPDAEEREGVTRATSDNLATWTAGVLKRFGIVPPTWVLNKLRDWLFGATTDNASAETRAAVDVMGIYSHRCGNHTLDLPLKRLLQVKKKTGARTYVAEAEEEEDVEEPEEDEPEAEPQPDGEDDAG
jgi:hypothetical protein